MRAFDTEYVVFDVETTGLSPLNGDRILEIAAVKVKSGRVVDTLESLVNPGRELSAEAQQINNITAQMLADAPSAIEVLPRMLEFIGGACLMGHNIKFDLDFLCYELALIRRKLRDETPALDTLKMAKAFLPHLTTYRLSHIARMLGITVKETHRALADVQLTAEVAQRLMEIGRDRSVVSFQQLYRDFGVQKPSFKMETAAQELLF